MRKETIVGWMLGGIIVGIIILQPRFGFYYGVLVIFSWGLWYYQYGTKICNFCGKEYYLKDKLRTLPFENFIKKTNMEYYLQPKVETIDFSPSRPPIREGSLHICKDCYGEYLDKVKK